MKIQIAERLQPFSHRPGVSCLIPGTTCKIEAFPTLIRLDGVVDLILQLTGPVREFTLQQDLEKSRVLIFGKAREGFYRLQFKGNPNGIELLADKVPQQGLKLNDQLFRPKERKLFACGTHFFLPTVWERLSLGMSKKQDWDLVLRRFDLKEILPVLFGLSQKIPQQSDLMKSDESISLPSNQIEALESFCRFHFSNLLVPRWHDGEYQGYAHLGVGNLNSAAHCAGSDRLPCHLLQEAARWIRGLFFRQEKNCLILLPASPFDAGRLTQVQAEHLGEIDLEWASGFLRRAVFRSAFSGPISLMLQKGLDSWRVRTILASRGCRCNLAEPLMVEAGKTYFFDRFHKIL